MFISIWAAYSWQLFQLRNSAACGGGADLISVYKYLKGGCKKDWATLFSVVPSDRKHRNFHLSIREYFFFTVRVSKRGTRLPREVVGFPSLEIFKSLLGYSPWQPALGDPVWAEGLVHVSARGPFQLQSFCDFVKLSEAEETTTLTFVGRIHNSGSRESS